MKYKCQLVSMAQMLIGPDGLVMPLCNSCGTCDCSNPIENRQVSIMGLPKKCKIYSKGSSEYMVVSCVGYSKK